jgi:hypothetical protein
MARNDVLQHFLDTAFVAFDQRAQDLRARRSVSQIFANLEMEQPVSEAIGKRLPVCNRYLESALDVKVEQATLSTLIQRFRALEPHLTWVWKSTYDSSASENFLMSHANTMITGPGGFEDRNDIWLGATLMAPHVRYPDHDHSPEETYLVLSDGQFKQGQSDWFSPGIGGSFYNEPGIRHAMRSADKPLFAFWALLVDQPKH